MSSYTKRINATEMECITIALKVGDQAFIVNMPEDDKRLLMKMAAGLSDDGKLQLVKAPVGFKLTNIQVVKVQ